MANKEPRTSITSASSEAHDLLVTALADLGKVVGDTKTRVFFPNGIELISITVNVSAIKVELKVAGEKGIKGLLTGGLDSGEGVSENSSAVERVVR